MPAPISLALGAPPYAPRGWQDLLLPVAVIVVAAALIVLVKRYG